MNDRQRFLHCIRFGQPDRFPHRPQGFWRATLERWHEEGLDPDTPLRTAFGFDDWRILPIDVTMRPGFPEEVLDDSGGFITRRGRNGVVSKVRSDNPELSMPEWVDFPVHEPGDFAALKRHYDPTDPGRYPADWSRLVATAADREHVLGIDLYNGLYMTLREWLGPEDLLYAFYDEPALIHDMLDFYTDFLIATLEPAFAAIQVDYFSLSEDMAYKNGPFISPAQFREFFVPRYRRLADMVRRHGVEALMIDSDGNLQALIPDLLEAGFNGIHPCEVAAGNDVVALRQEYGKDLLLWCGIDKRVLCQGPAAIRAEVDRKLPALWAAGGYIPHIDHSVPPNVSLADYRTYLDLIAELEAGALA